ncbi:helix-turn-helix domain-containing protein [Pseudidiomarina halophila]
MRERTPDPQVSPAQGEAWPTLQEVQDRYVQQVLAETDGNKQRAAKILGVTRRTLYRWITTDS